MINVGFGLARDEPIEEIELEIEDDEDKKDAEDEEEINPEDLEVEELSPQADEKKDESAGVHDDL